MSDRTPFEKRTQEILDESAARLDGRTLSRLTQARHAALAGSEKPRAAWRWYVPAGAVAAAAVLGVMLNLGQPPVTEPLTASNPGASAVEDLDLLTDADAPDFVNDGEDLEFYEWAAEEMES